MEANHQRSGGSQSLHITLRLWEYKGANPRRILLEEIGHRPLSGCGLPPRGLCWGRWLIGTRMSCLVNMLLFQRWHVCRVSTKTIQSRTMCRQALSWFYSIFTAHLLHIVLCQRLQGLRKRHYSILLIICSPTDTADTPTWMAKIITGHKCWWGHQGKNYLFTISGSANWHSHYRNQCGVSSQIWK